MSAANSAIRGRAARGPKAEQGLKGRRWLPAPIVAEDEFVQVDRQLRLAHAMLMTAA